MTSLGVMGLLFAPLALATALTLPAGALALMLPAPFPGAAVLTGAGLI